MWNANTPAGATTGANLKAESAAHDTTAPAMTVRLEDAFLRALFTLPAAQILTVVDALDAGDIHGPHHRIILDAITRNARLQSNRGNGYQAVDPVIVLQDLLRAGALDAVKSVLLHVVTGDPVPDAWLGDLAAGLRENQLRRACVTVGESLAQAGYAGGHEDLVRTLSYLPRLFSLARRAGFDLGEVER